jgi:hypothetical protein
MDTRWQAVTQDTSRAAQVWHHPTATPVQMVTATHTDGVDLTAFVSRVSHSASDASVTLNWHQELNGAAQPQPGTLLELRLDGQLLWWGVIEALNDYRLSSGTRTLTLTARSRDASTLWREIRRVSALYPVATPLSVIARDIAASLGLTDSEIAFGESAATTVHSNTQLADLSAWEMLEKIWHPLGQSPFIDARGMLKTISRDISRAADIVLANERIIAIGAAKSRAPLTLVRIKWLDPHLTKVSQQNQKLAAETITAGYFQIHQKKHIPFSADGTQRAENTYLVVRQSANSSLLPVCEETYSQQTQTDGEILLKTSMWVPALITGSMAAMLYAANIPDATTGGPGVGETIPIGRRIQAAAELTVLLVMASIGTGMYEVWGTPYDFVNARNTTEAYDEAAPEWLGNEQEIENDFVMDEPMAQAYAVRELIYQARAAASYTVSIVDDPRIEPGDILQLPDASRLYVTGYRRDLSPGAAAVLEIEGLRA